MVIKIWGFFKNNLRPRVGAWSSGKKSRCKNQTIIKLILHMHIFSRIVASTAWSKTTSQLVGCAKILYIPQMDPPTLSPILQPGQHQQTQCAQQHLFRKDSATVSNISKTFHAVNMTSQVECAQQVQWQNWQQQHVKMNSMSNLASCTAPSIASWGICARRQRFNP